MSVLIIGGSRTNIPSPSRRRRGPVGIPSNTILGRQSPGMGLQESLTPKQAREVLNLWETNDVFFNSLRLSNTTNNIAGTIQWDGSDFLGYDGSQWRSLTSGVGGIDTKTISATYDNNTSKVTFSRDDGATFLLDLSQLVSGSGISLNNLSVLPKPPASGDGHLGYDNTTGEFVYTPPDLSGYLTAEQDPIFSAHTSSNISNGTGFLKNDGSGTWSYDSNTYLTSSDIYTDSDVNTLLNVSPTSPTSGYVLSWNGTDYAWVAQNSSSSGINLTDLSVLPEPNPAGDGHLGYDHTTGEFTFTPPDLSGYLTSSDLDYYTDSDVDARLDSDIAGDGQILSWDDTNNKYVWVDSPTLTETVTSLNIAANVLTYNREDGTTDQYDLGALYLDDTNLAYITSGTLNSSTGIATFTRNDGTDFTIDMSSLLNVTLADLSVTNPHPNASGSGDLTYDNTTGAFTYTPPDLSSYLTSADLSGYLTSEQDPIFAASPAGSITTQQVTNWDEAHTWGNHGSVGYALTSNLNYYTDSDVDAHLNNGGSISDGQILSWDVTANNNNGDYVWINQSSSSSGINLTDLSITNPHPNAAGSGDLTYDDTTGAFTYTPPDLSSYLTNSSPAGSITTQQVTNWDEAHTWGDHANAGYLTSFSETVTSLSLTSGDLKYTDESGTVTNIPLSSYENQVLTVNGYVGNVSLTKANIGLGNVDNTSDADKPISTATQTALDLKVNYTDVLSSITSTNKIVTQSDIAALGGGDMLQSVYDTTGNGIVDNAEKVNGFTVGVNVPANAVFTDTVYTDSNVDTHLNKTTNDGYVLSWNSSLLNNAGDYEWVEKSDVSSLEELDDVDVFDTTYPLTDGSFLTYISGTNQWKPTSLTLNYYTDSDVDTRLKVSPNSPTDGYVLSWDVTANNNNGDYAWINKGNTLLNISDNAQGVVLGAGKKLQTNDIELDTGSTLNAEGCTINFGSSTIIGLGDEIRSEINTHLNVTPTNPTDGYVLSWDTSANAGQGDFAWVAQTSGGINLSDLSITNPHPNAAGSGDLTYDDTTGAFTYTPPDLSGYVLTSNLDYYTDTDVDARLDSVLALDGQILSWDDTNNKYVWIDSPTFSETTTSLTLTNGSLIYTDEDGTQTPISLDAYLDEDSRSIASGVLDSVTGIVTFTRDNNSTFTLDLSDLLDDTNLVTSVNGKNGVVVLSKSDIGLGNVDNTSDVDKPISTATQTALDLKVNYTDVLSSITSTNKIVTQSDIPSLTETDTLDDVVTRGNTTTTTAVIPFLYPNQSSFPNASTYHGAIAHSHADGAMYFAHNLIWNKLANDSQLANSSNWDLAHSWGDHSTAGYSNITSSDAAPTTPSDNDLWWDSDEGVLKIRYNDGSSQQWVDISSSASGIQLTDLSVGTPNSASSSGAITYDDSTGVFTYTPPDLSGYLTSFSELDPVFTASPAGSITNTNKTNWDLAHSWGDHANAGYLTAEQDPVFSAHTSSNISNGTGFLKNDGSGTWSYDNNTYLTAESDPIFSAHTSSNISNGTGFLKNDGSGTWSYVTDNSADWDEAHGWGNHANAGYLSSGDVSWTVSGDDIYSSNSGNVGIGTTTPLDKLEVSGGVRVSESWSETPSSSGVLDYFSTGSAKITRLISQGTDSSRGQMRFLVQNNVGSDILEALNINSSGDVGVGVDNIINTVDTSTPPTLDGTGVTISNEPISNFTYYQQEYSRSMSVSGDGNVLAVSAARAVGITDGCVHIYRKNVNDDWVLSQTLSNPDELGYEDFGTSVSLSSDGNLMAVGVYWLEKYEDGAVGTGHTGSAPYATTYYRSGVYIYEYDGSSWGVRDTILDPKSTPSKDFGKSVALSSDGSILIVGTTVYDTSNYLSQGAVYRFHYDSGGLSWNQVDFLHITTSGGYPVPEFGSSVSISDDGSILAVGAIGHDTSSTNNDIGGNEGRVYTYTWDVGNFTYISRGSSLEESPEGLNFGRALALTSDGNTLVVSSKEERTQSNSPNVGSVHIYDWTGSWVKRNFIMNEPLEPLGANNFTQYHNDNFGVSVAVTNPTSGAKLFIGNSDRYITTNAGQGSSYEGGIFSYASVEVPSTVFEKLEVGGAIKISSTSNSPSASDAGIIQWSGSDFLGYTGSEWASLTYSDPDVQELLKTSGSNAGEILSWSGTDFLWTTEQNDLTSNVTWDTVPDQYISEASVRQHEGTLSISESQISDLNHYEDADVNTLLNKTATSDGQLLTWDETNNSYNWITKASLSSSITIDKTQITDLGNYVSTISGTTNEIQVTGTASSGAAFTIGLPDSVTITNDLTVGGNLSINGTSTRIDSTVTTITDPVISIGGRNTTSDNFADLISNDTKDRGIEFKYWDSTANSSKLGFMGWNTSISKFGFYKDATNNTETFGGTASELDAKIDWSNILNKPTTAGVDTDTTYTVKASSVTGGGASLDLDAGGSGSGTDKVNFKGSGATTVTRTDADNITISSTDTTYSTATSTTEGLVKIGYTLDGAAQNYPVQLSYGKMYVNVPWTTYAAGTGLSLSGANQFSLSKATNTALGGVKLTTTTAQTVAANTASTDTGRTYPVQFNSSDQLVVNVPWTDGSGSLTSSQWTDVTGGINYSSGKVGIGTSSPNKKLHVTDSNEIVATLTNSTNAAATKTLLRFSQNNDTDVLAGTIGINRDGPNAGCGFEINLADSNGAEQNRLTILEDGNVGIGTTSPGAKLDIDIGISNSLGLRVTSSNNSAVTGDHISASTLRGDTSAYNLLNLTNVAGTKFRVQGDGKVGIGTATPDGTLHVKSSGTSAENVVAFGNGNINSGLYVRTDDGNLEWGLATFNQRDLIFETNQTRRMTIDGATGNIGIGASFTKSSPSVTPSYELHVREDQAATTNIVLQNHTVNTSANAQIFVETKPSAGDPQIQFQIDGTEAYSVGIDNSDGDKFKISDFGTLGTNDRLVIDSTGKVGIGESTPLTQLHVGGNVRVEKSIITSGVIECFENVPTTIGGAAGYTINVSNTGERKLIYLGGGTDADTRLNITNIDIAVGEATNFSIVIEQTAAAAYIVDEITISTSSSVSTTTETIKWQGGSAPTGNANGVDIFSFTIFRTASSTYTVLGNMVDYS